MDIPNANNWHNGNNGEGRKKRMRVKVGPQGRVVIPSALREQLNLGAGEELIARAEDGRLVLERRDDVVRRLRAVFGSVAPGRVLSDELIAERRAEARREEGHQD